MEKLGSVDVLINNAGLGYEKSFIDQTEEEILQVLNTNLISQILLTKEFLPNMLEKGDGKIIYVTSLAGKIGFPELAPYSASKFGVEGFAETLREELKNTGVKICVVRPGVTDTPFFQPAGMTEYYHKVKKSGKIHPPESVAKAILKNINIMPDEIVVGSDRIYLRILPFIPYKWRFKLLDFINLFN